jgi:hypothetical protein
MNSLSPHARKKNLLEQYQRPRTTRQMDQKKRQTVNSREDKEINFSNVVGTKKKQKLNIDIDDRKIAEIDRNIDELNNTHKSTIESSIKITANLFEDNSDTEDDDKTTDSENRISTPLNLKKKSFINNLILDKENENQLHAHNVEKFSLTKDKPNLLGIGHISVLHAYVRDVLFKKIKIISNDHLETNGEIMTEVLKKLKYSANIHGNFAAFTNACRTEIRKTICSRRGYVKRQIGILLTGK